jgi:hypothetical protein
MQGQDFGFVLFQFYREDFGFKTVCLQTCLAIFIHDLMNLWTIVVL